MSKQIDISEAVEFLKSKFNGEVQRLYGANECAKLLAEFGKSEYQKGYDDCYRAIQEFEYRRDNE